MKGEGWHRLLGLMQLLLQVGDGCLGQLQLLCLYAVPPPLPGLLPLQFNLLLGSVAAGSRCPGCAAPGATPGARQEVLWARGAIGRCSGLAPVGCARG